MHSRFPSTIAVATATLLAVANGSVLPRGYNEHVVLANCYGNGAQSSEMAYYSGIPISSPDAIAVVQSGSEVTWEGNSISGTFSDGDVFTSNIVSPKVSAGFAGKASNNYGPFYCDVSFTPALYTDANGNTCDMIYVCGHIPPPSVPSPPPPTPPGPPPSQGTARFDFTVGGSYASMPGHWLASDMLATVDQAIGDEYCDSQKSIQIGDGSCNIIYTCHGDVIHDTTYGMAQMLKTVVAAQPNIVNYVTHRVKTCIDTNPEVKPGQDPCIYEYVDTAFTEINNSLAMNVVYVPANNPAGAADQGQLSYSITCPSPAGANCGLCHGVAAGLEGAGVASSIPEVQTFFAGAQFITDAACVLAGC